LSGIVGIFQRDGASLGAARFHKLVLSLDISGSNPTNINSANIWVERNAGLGHRPLGSFSASGIASLAATALHIIADVRLDSRAQLRAKIAAWGSESASDANDAELLLHAYAQWGADCVDHLRGEFAFAIWDAHAQTLFCARDHFGIKPFYYALFDSVFVFSNVLNAVRLHPRVSAELNDSAVADFLLFGLNCDNGTTTFHDIQRLPPAHALLVSRDAIKLRRYWEVPIDGRIRYSNASDYIENFLAVWKPAVADRLDAQRTGIMLSGGLDSSSVAATAKECAPLAAGNLRAFTIAHPQIGTDTEPQLAAGLAHFLGIPFRSLVADELRPFEHWGHANPITPEPVDDPLFASLPLAFKEISRDCHAVLSGEGADNLLHFQMTPYALDLFARREWLHLIGELSRFAWRRPFPWRGMRKRVQGIFGRGEMTAPPFPKWLASDFARRLDLPARWAAGQLLPIPPHRHPICPTAHASMYLPQWTRMFELENPSVTKCPVEVRYPFLDLRVVEYLLAIPPFPWAFQKTVLRQAMAGRVLETVRTRPKTPFAGDPLLLQLQRYGPFGVDTRLKAGTKSEVKTEVQPPVVARVESKVERGRLIMNETDSSKSVPPPIFPPDGGELGQYINLSSLSPLHGKMASEQVNQMARPFCFNFWLQSVRKVGYN
jgi:asparagine synthase (glutamine-hydrolysing)